MHVKATRTTIIAIEGLDSFSPFIPYGLFRDEVDNAFSFLQRSAHLSKNWCWESVSTAFLLTSHRALSAFLTVTTG